jgi:hypothetical protein
MSALLGLFNFNRIWYYVVLAGSISVLIGIAILRIRASGAQSERLKQLENTMKRKQLDAEISANLSAISAAARRKQLRDRWSRR